MGAPTYINADPLHPDTANKLYSQHWPARILHAAEITSVSATITGGASVDDVAYANPGDADHTAAEARDERDYDGPLTSVWISAGTAIEGDVLYLTIEILTDLIEGPIHRTLRIAVTERGM